MPPSPRPREGSHIIQSSLPGSPLHTHAKQCEEKGEKDGKSLVTKMYYHMMEVDATPLSVLLYDAERGVASTVILSLPSHFPCVRVGESLEMRLTHMSTHLPHTLLFGLYLFQLSRSSQFSTPLLVCWLQL